MKKLSLFLMFVLLGSGLMVQTVQAADITAAPDMIASEKTTAKGPLFNARFAISPYAQVTPNATYTFIGISHPSLATAHTSIGIAVEAMDMTTVPNNAAGRAAVFTVDAGTTHRVFIVNQGHATINASNSLFTDSLTHLITTADSDQFGNIKVTSIGTVPTFHTTESQRPGKYRSVAANTVSRWDNVAQLAMWGVIYQSSNGAGFALEFIGDMHDSNALGNATTGFEAKGHDKSQNTSAGGRGIN